MIPLNKKILLLTKKHAWEGTKAVIVYRMIVAGDK